MRPILSMVCAASLFYFVSFVLVGLIATALGYGNRTIPYPVLGYAFVASVYVLPFALVDLRGLRGRNWASFTAGTLSIALVTLTAAHWHWIEIDSHLRNSAHWLGIASEASAFLLAASLLGSVTKQRLHDRVQALLAFLPRSIRDDAEGMIREFAERRDAHRATGRGSWFTIAVCGWDFIGYLVRSATYVVFTKLLGKLIGKLLGF